MNDIKKLLVLKQKMNAKRPKFIRQDAHRFEKLEKKWVRPAGLHSKIRQKIIGHGVLVKPGYRSPRALRSLSRDGTQLVRVFTVSDIERLDPQKQSALMGGSVGKRKRLELVVAAQKKGLKLTNIRDAENYPATVQRELQERKRNRTERLNKKKKEEKKKPSLEEKTEKEKSSDDIKKEKDAERREAEKAMISTP